MHHLLELDASVDQYTDDELEHAYRVLRRTYKKKQKGIFGFFKKPEYLCAYRYHLIIEAFAFLLLEERGQIDVERYLEDISKIFYLGKKKKAFFTRYFYLLFQKDFSTLFEHVKQADIKYMAESIMGLTEHIVNAMKYENLPVFNIAVVATMSAGKSTFVNALLGQEIFPTSNEACTAKITSVYDNDVYKRVVGVAMHGKTLFEASNELSNEDLKSWNSNKSINRLVLEGNLDNIKNEQGIIAVHDSPGTNFSGDETHHDITFNFLKENKMDAIIYVANATQIATNDEKALLTELYEKIVKLQDIPVIFVLNKADCIDSEKESLEGLVHIFKKSLDSIGYARGVYGEKACIIPVSARYARLFKMALSERIEMLSPKELIDTKTNLELFLENDEIASFHSDMTFEQAGRHAGFEDNGECVVIRGEDVKKDDIMHSIFNTGIMAVEVELSKIAKNSIER